ncbi:HlyD family type I secretion periplasmic adaptor subunit [Phyllobacterium brassicacearum]|uniref:Membrane fusion protein (MFP) family protein n=1 Tax=Phyllobacterium brassicacearum TaxID=314235 RepID=A0A2P7BWX2_9HYPH|nr:HlyD family type I secretion periplasmic adaptor subunit [Phyllobacterium brassicacearum]PSH70936.1 HlyD family type I secretion periplasmic adaptor subunit [Phyllobacterium brassicacearum]TDQ35560.1 HlyD family secretion protein [Phyllobacterium brassicacearum]
MATTSALNDLDWYEGVPRSIKPYTKFGLVMVVVCFGGFGTWAATAPLAAAVIAPGSFVATGQNKVVQHLEGGIIKELLVREGDRVAEGDQLVRLDETAARANSQQLFFRQARLEAILARLHAVVRGDDRYQPPQIILDNLANPEIRAVNDSQSDNFEAAHAKYANELQMMQRNISALEFRRIGRNAQIAATRTQVGLLKDEYQAKYSLYKKGLMARSEVSVLERAVADGEGTISRLEAEIMEVNAQIEKFQKEIIQTKDTEKQAALDEIQSAEAELDAIREQIRQADSVLTRTVVKAPVSGTVVRMHYHTAGGVIETGKPIIEILPTGVPLIIEAQIPRMQIDEVKEGQEAHVRLSALNQRTTPVINGRVDYVSADAMTDTTTDVKQEIYLARVSIPAEQLARIHGFTPTPGMPADILIQTHERTFFEYLAKPVLDSMSRAFREQ